MPGGRSAWRDRCASARSRRVRHLRGRRTFRQPALRLYERCGLLTPARSDGGTRRYSADDLARLRRISMLVEAGVNLAGIARILDLEDDNVALSATNTDLRSTNRTLRKAAQAGANDDADG
jgi:MerR family transcriptional regulator, heat shock protein HspR